MVLGRNESSGSDHEQDRRTSDESGRRLLGANLRVRRLGSRDDPHDGHRHVQLIGRFCYTVRVDLQRVAVASWQD